MLEEERSWHPPGCTPPSRLSIPPRVPPGVPLSHRDLFSHKKNPTEVSCRAEIRDRKNQRPQPERPCLGRTSRKNPFFAQLLAAAPRYSFRPCGHRPPAPLADREGGPRAARETATPCHGHHRRGARRGRPPGPSPAARGPPPLPTAPLRPPPPPHSRRQHKAPSGTSQRSPPPSGGPRRRQGSAGPAPAAGGNSAARPRGGEERGRGAGRRPSLSLRPWPPPPRRRGTPRRARRGTARPCPPRPPLPLRSPHCPSPRRERSRFSCLSPL